MVGVNGNTFLFDEVLDGSTQNQVYTDLAKPMVNKVMQGFNITLLAYGQTGTGKTYTMGFENNVGFKSAPMNQLMKCINIINYLLSNNIPFYVNFVGRH